MDKIDKRFIMFLFIGVIIWMFAAIYVMDKSEKKIEALEERVSAIELIDSNNDIGEEEIKKQW